MLWTGHIVSLMTLTDIHVYAELTAAHRRRKRGGQTEVWYRF